MRTALLPGSAAGAGRFVSAMASASIALAGLLVAARSLYLGVTLSTPVPYEDQWEFVGDLMRFKAGDYGVLDLFSRQNEHRILTARLSFFADYFCCHLGNLSVVLTSYAVLAALAALLSAVAARERPWRVKAVVFAIALPSLWSLAGWINLGWAFQVQWAYVHALPAASIVLFAAAARRTGRSTLFFLGGACLSDALGIVSMASGLVTIVPVVAVALWMRARPAPLVCFAVLHLIMAVLYLQGYEPSDYPPVFDPPRLLAYLLPYLGTAFPQSATSSTIVGGIGLVLALAAMTSAALWALRGRPLDPPSAALLGIAAFVLAEGLVTSIGRAAFPDPTRLALRYGTPSEVFWTALGLVAWRWCWRKGLMSTGRRAAQARWAARGLAAASLAGVIGGNVVGSSHQNWAQWSAAVDNEGFNLINGITTGPSALETYPQPDDIQDRFAFLRDQSLGSFAVTQRSFRPPMQRLRGVVPTELRACAGILDLFAVAGGQIHVRGWAATPGLPRSAVWIVVLGADRRLLGLARPFDRRWDEHQVSGMPVILGYDFWFLEPGTEDRAGLSLVALFPEGTAPACRIEGGTGAS